jgi:hypothetical protein
MLIIVDHYIRSHSLTSVLYSVISPSQLAESVMLLTCISEESGFKSAHILMVFFSPFKQMLTLDVKLFMTFFHALSNSVSFFNAVQSAVLTASLNNNK